MKNVNNAGESPEPQELYPLTQKAINKLADTGNGQELFDLCRKMEGLLTANISELKQAEKELTELLFARVLDSTMPGFYVVRQARNVIREHLETIAKLIQ